MSAYKLRTVYDVSCGRGYELINILAGYDITGINLPETVNFIKARYPNRR
jgi:hypothetical protein